MKFPLFLHDPIDKSHWERGECGVSDAPPNRDHVFWRRWYRDAATWRKIARRLRRIANAIDDYVRWSNDAA